MASVDFRALQCATPEVRDHPAERAPSGCSRQRSAVGRPLLLPGSTSQIGGRFVEANAQYAILFLVNT